MRSDVKKNDVAPRLAHVALAHARLAHHALHARNVRLVRNALLGLSARPARLVLHARRARHARLALHVHLVPDLAVVVPVGSDILGSSMQSNLFSILCVLCFAECHFMFLLVDLDFVICVYVLGSCKLFLMHGYRYIFHVFSCSFTVIFGYHNAKKNIYIYYKFHIIYKFFFRKGPNRNRLVIIIIIIMYFSFCCLS